MKKMLTLATALLCSAPAFSGSITCSGTVTKIAYHTNNSIMLMLSSMNTPVFVCNTDAVHTAAGTSFQTGINMCKALIAVFLKAQATGTTLNSVLFDGDSVPATCNSWAPWQSAVIRYFDH